jgi:hypothetical protein
MRRIHFDGSKESQENFRIFYDSWRLGARGVKGLEALRTAGAIQDAFEALSDPVGNTPEITINKPQFRALPPELQKEILRSIVEEDGSGVRVLKESGGVLGLEESEYTMLKAAMDAMEWRSLVAKIALRALELITNTKKEAAS